MQRWYGYCLFPIFILLLTACSFTDGSIVEVQAAPMPVEDPPADLSESAELAITSDPLAGTDPTGEAKLPDDGCPTTPPPELPFTPPAPYPAQAPGDYFWYGSPALWTAVPTNGIWSDLPHNPSGYTQKVFWWREGYSWTEEPQPQLTATGRRLDAAAPSLIVSRATNAFAADIQSAMLVGVDFPTLGCWEITGKYADQTLTFVVQIEP